jgi:hypothetical protein
MLDGVDPQRVVARQLLAAEREAPDEQRLAALRFAPVVEAVALPELVEPFHDAHVTSLRVRVPVCG